jgi:hypothetical protein
MRFTTLNHFPSCMSFGRHHLGFLDAIIEPSNNPHRPLTLPASFSDAPADPETRPSQAADASRPCTNIRSSVLRHQWPSKSGHVELPTPENRKPVFQPNTVRPVCRRRNHVLQILPRRAGNPLSRKSPLRLEIFRSQNRATSSQ